jgi:hypothetical protein
MSGARHAVASAKAGAIESVEPALSVVERDIARATLFVTGKNSLLQR